MRTTGRILLVLSLAALSSSVFADDPAQLFSDLESGNREREAAARQKLPRYGSEVVTSLTERLRHTDPVVSRVAFLTLNDTVNLAGMDQVSTSPERISDQLLPLLESNQSVEQQIDALRLIRFSLPSDAGVEAVVRHLEGADPRLREEARTALETIGGQKAAAALAAALDRVPDDYRPALIRSLHNLRDRNSLPRLRELARDGNSTPTRSAAIHALAETGSAEDLTLIEEAAGSSDTFMRHEAQEALLQVAESAETDAAARPSGIYIRLLKEGTPAVQCAALVGLGRTGSTEAADAIFTSLPELGIPERRVALDALADIPGDDMTRRLVELYAPSDPSIGVALIRVLSRRNSDSVIPILAEAVRSDREEIVREALHGLGVSAHSEAIGPLTALLADDASQAVHPLVCKSLFTLADALAASDASHTQASGAYMTLLDSVKDEENRIRALRGLARCPTPDAFTALLKAARDPSLRNAAIPALTAAVPFLEQSGRQQQAREAVDALLSLDLPFESLQKVLEEMQRLGNAPDPDRFFGTIREWWVAGPFNTESVSAGYDTPFIDERAMSRESLTADGKPDWKRVRSEGMPGVISLTEQLGDCKNAFGYAYTEIEMPERRVIQLRMGTDDGVAVWLNGAKVYENQTDRGVVPDQDIVNVRFEKGVNRLLLKISQVVGGWGYYARLTDKEGRPVEFRIAGAGEKDSHD